MKLLNIFKSFKNDESGAVTVDWVVLTAAIVGMGVLVLGAVQSAVAAKSTSIVSQISGPIGAGAGAGAAPAPAPAPAP